MMKPEGRCRVALQHCEDYEHGRLKEQIDQACRAIDFKIQTGATVLLKPNLVAAGSGPDHLACTSPEFVGAVAEWCLGHGASVKVGDSPAFGSGRMVMRACGMAEVLKPLGVELVNFSRSRPVKMPCGLTVPLATAAFDCDVLVNLPKVKAHNQLYVSLAVKNYFGLVIGWRKALHHAVNGDVAHRFEELLVDLLALFPAVCSVLDGIIAMHRTGPMQGEKFPLQLIGASFDPVALDSAVMRTIGADFAKSQLWMECQRRGLAGTDLAALEFPLQNPEDFAAEGFILPARLSPVTFHPGRMLVGMWWRGVSGFLGNDR
jgi:uncharacterized protein (DUF362 family)